MNYKSLFFLVVFFTASVSACKEAPPPDLPGKLKVLFVGNSYTYFNGGVDQLVKNMLLADDPEGDYVFDDATVGGYFLQSHNADSITLAKLNAEEWDYVVLQEQSFLPVSNPDAFYAAARDIDERIVAAGAATAFFMTWAREYDPPMIDALESAYATIATELDALLCPVGKGWEYALAEDPDLVLHTSDGSHPTPEGTYLAACIFYAIFNSESPVGNNFDYSEVEKNTQHHLQELAWDFILEY